MTTLISYTIKYLRNINIFYHSIDQFNLYSVEKIIIIMHRTSKHLCASHGNTTLFDEATALGYSRKCHYISIILDKEHFRAVANDSRLSLFRIPLQHKQTSFRVSRNRSRGIQSLEPMSRAGELSSPPLRAGPVDWRDGGSWATCSA